MSWINLGITDKLKEAVKNSFLDLTFLTPCLELKMKSLYEMSLVKRDYIKRLLA